MVQVVGTILACVRIYISSTSMVETARVRPVTASGNTTGTVLRASAAESTGGRQWPCSEQGNAAV